MAVFRVPDIECDACIRAMTGAVRRLDGLSELHADLQTKQVRVDSTASDSAVAAAIRGAGFTVEAA